MFDIDLMNQDNNQIHMRGKLKNFNNPNIHWGILSKVDKIHFHQDRIQMNKNHM